MRRERLTEKIHSALLWLWKTLPLPRWGRWAILWVGNTKFLVGVVGVVFDDRERVLVLRHTYRRRYPWGLPGGWVDGSEPLERGLARELREETGMAIDIGEVFHVRSGYRRPQMDVYYLCTYQEGQFRANAEIAEARFCALDALPADMLPMQRPILERALDLRRQRQARDGAEKRA
jgi:8-oxo-dGTP diphosphatase